MTNQLITIKQNRKFLISLIKGLTNEQLNQIPNGFNNNIIWHITHLLVTQQSIIYKRFQLPMIVSDDLLKEFGGGSKPERKLSEAEIDSIKQQLEFAIEKLETDIKTDLFASKSYETWTTRTGAELKNIEDAVNFVMFHEGIHFGYVMAMKRILSTN